MTSVEIVEAAAREVLRTTAGTVAGGARRQLPDKSFTGFVATISFVGSQGGTLVMCCHQPLAAAMAKGMLGMNGEEPDEETVRDALGELVNQIGGSIKRKIGAAASELTLSVPVVVSGAPLSHGVRSSADPVAVELAVGDGNLCVCLWPA